MPNFFSQIIAKIISSAISFVYLFTGYKSGLTGEEIKTPEDFTPILRFIACSDVHLDGNEEQPNAIRLANLIKDMYKYSELQDYKTVDALMVVGDFAGGGAESEYATFNKIIKDNIKPQTQVLTVLGNHEFIEYRDYDPTIGYDVYKKMISEDVDTDIVEGIKRWVEANGDE